jgi:type VI secretion system secreted protein Hcp
MKKRSVLLFAGFILLMTNICNSQSKTFLKLDGIDGDVTQAGFEHSIAVSGVEQITSNSATVTGAGGGAGKVSLGDFKIRKQTDKTSPLLMSQIATGRHLRSAVLTTVNLTGGDSYTITLSDVMLTGISSSTECNPACKTVETLTINYRTIIWEYKDRNGKITRFGWDIGQSRPVN